MSHDPLEDDPLVGGPFRRARSASPDACPQGGRCDGSGWVQVQPEYAIHLHPSPPLPELDATAAQLAAYDNAMRSVEALRASARDSWYPCRACSPAAFYRWAGRHFNADHNKRTCEECSSGGKRASA